MLTVWVVEIILFFCISGKTGTETYDFWLTLKPLFSAVSLLLLRNTVYTQIQILHGKLGTKAYMDA